MSGNRGAAIAQMNLSSAWGGMEMSTLKIARHFKQQGFKSFIITSPDSPLAKEAKSESINVIEIPGEGHFAPRASWKLRRALKRDAIGMIMVHQLRNLWILRPALWGMPNVRVVGFARMFIKNIRKTDFLHRHLYLRLEKMVALCQTQRLSVQPCLPLPDDRYVVIPNGIDIEKFNPRHRREDLRRQEFGASQTDRVVGVIGRLDPQKGQMEFVEAAAAVLKKYPQTKFAIIGSETLGEPGFAAKLHARAKELKIENKITFLGHRTDTPALMASLDIFVMPSYEEAFGNVVLESMASQVATIATNAGGPIDILQDGEWGRLVPPRESEGLAEAIIQYLDDPSLISRHAKRGREVVEMKYPLPLVMKQIEDLFG